MSILPIVKTPNPILRQVAKSVAKIDKKVIRLILDMVDTLKNQKDPEGVGLAAPQVGESLRIFLIKPNRRSEITIVVNPEVLSTLEIPSSEKHTKSHLLEGCLSIPHIYSDIKRSKEITIKYESLDTKNNQVHKLSTTFTDFPAQVVQHELDHLNGKLFVDRALEQKQKILKLEGDEWEEVTPGVD